MVSYFLSYFFYTFTYSIYSKLISVSNLMCEAVFSSRRRAKYTVPLIKLTIPSPSVEMSQAALRTESQAWVESQKDRVKPWLLIPHSSDCPHVCQVVAVVSLGKCLYNHLFLFKRQAVSRVRTKEKEGVESRQKDSLPAHPHLPSTQDLVQVRKPGPSNPSLLRASVGQHPAGLQDL